MTALEWILFIFVLVEIGQMAALVYNTRKTNKYIHDILTNEEYAATVATNMLFGFIAGLDATGKKGNDLELAKIRQQQLFGFINACGQAALGKVGDMASSKLRGSAKKAADWLTVASPFLQMLGYGQEGKAAEVAANVASRSTLPPLK